MKNVSEFSVLSLNSLRKMYFMHLDYYIIFKMTGSLKYELGILIFSSQLKFPEEDVF